MYIFNFMSKLSLKVEKISHLTRRARPSAGEATRRFASDMEYFPRSEKSSTLVTRASATGLGGHPRKRDWPGRHPQGASRRNRRFR